MKKLFSLLLAAFLVFAAVFMLIAPALADTGGAESPEFFTWAVLATYAGALAATIAITQLLKGVGFIERIPTRLFSWFIACAILLAANYFIGSLTVEAAGICILNSVVISLAANGGYDMIASVKMIE